MSEGKLKKQRQRTSACVLAVLTGSAASPVLAATYYWDINSGSAGSGAVSGIASGTWAANSLNWSTSSTGNATTSAVTTSAADTVVIAAGTDATGNTDITLSGTQVFATMIVEEGSRIRFANGAFAFGSTTPVLDVRNTTTQLLNSLTDISGTAGLTKIGAGQLDLGAVVTYTGVTTIQEGSLRLVTGSNRLSASSTMVLAAGMFDMNNMSQQLAGFTMKSGTLTAGTSSQTSTLTSTTDFIFESGTTAGGTGTGQGIILAGNVGLNKNTSGTMTWVGKNLHTYTGVTSLNGGVLSTSVLADGGAASGIGAATNSAANLVFNGGTLRYNGVTTSTNRGFTINNGSTGTIEVVSTVLSMSGGTAATTGQFVKGGSGQLIFTGASQYTGATTVRGGTLTFNGGSSTTIALIANGSGATLDLNSTPTFSATPTVTLANGGRLTASASASATLGNLNVDGGAAQVVTAASGSNLTIGNTWTFATGNMLNVNRVTGGVITSSPGTTNGIVTGSGDRGYATVTDSTGSGLATVSGGAITKLTTFTNLAAGSNSPTDNYTMAGNVMLTGSTNPTWNSLHADATTGRTLNLNGNTVARPAGTIFVTGADGDVLITGGGQVGASNQELVVHQYKAVAGDELIIESVISGGTGSFTVNGEDIDAIVWVSNTGNSYSGRTTINGGKLRAVTNAEVIPDASDVYVAAGASFSLFSNTPETINGLSGGGSVTNDGATGGTSLLTIRGSGNFTGVISDQTSVRTTSVTKSTGGVQTLAGVNTYTGPTNITGGRLNITGILTGTASVAVNSGTLSGTGTINTAAAVSVATGATIAPGSNSVGTLTVGATTLNAGGKLAMEINLGASSADQLRVNGLTLNGATLELSLLNAGPAGPIDPITFVLIDNFSANPIAGTGFVFSPPTSSLFAYSTSMTGGTGNDFTITITAVPEPGAMGVLAAAGIGLLRRRRRDR